MTLAIMHVTDTHGDVEQLKAAKAMQKLHEELTGNKVDLTVHTGDFIGLDRDRPENPMTQMFDWFNEMEMNSETHKAIVAASGDENKEFQNFLKENNGKITQLTYLSKQEELSKKYGTEELHGKHQEWMAEKSKDPELQKTILSLVKSAYDEIRPAMEDLGRKVVIPGNHDTTHSRKLLGDNIEFVETKKEVRIQDEEGHDFVIKGSFNSNSRPRTICHQFAEEALREHWEDYNSGVPMNKISEDQRQLVIDQIYQPELTRLTATGGADLYLVHDSPSNGEGSPAVEQYSQFVSAIRSGHRHHLSIKETQGVTDYNPGQQFSMGENWEFDEETQQFRLSETIIYKLFEWILVDKNDKELTREEIIEFRKEQEKLARQEYTQAA